MGCHYKCLVYTRMLFYISVIAIHMTNIFSMLSSFSEEAMKTQGVRDFYETQFYFFTCWNFSFQMAYAAFALFCDWASLGNTEKKPVLPECVTNFRERIFTILVWPGSWLVTTFFWAFYAYDRNLLYPEYFDLVVSPVNNHIMHTLITPIAVAELVLYPRKKPESHVGRVCGILGLEAVYILTLYYIHSTTGIWIYPVFSKLNNCPIGLVAFLVFIGFCILVFYYGQYCTSSFILKCREKIAKRYCKACIN